MASISSYTLGSGARRYRVDYRLPDRRTGQKAGFKAELAEVTMKPTTESSLAGDDAAKMQKLLDAIEAVDDVQDVYTNAVMDT